MTYEEITGLLKTYHTAACNMSYYNAAEGPSFYEEKEKRVEAIEILSKAQDALEVAGIPFPTGYLN